ncbi:MAG: V-type ATP synthase subunit E [Actinomycetota bacterium]
MSLEKLLEKIESDAREESRRILAEAEEEAARIKREAEEEARQEAESIARSFHARAENERLRIISQARLEGRIDLLAAKDQVLEEAFREVSESFRRLPPEGYRAWLKSVILGGVTSGREVLVPSPHDRELLAGGLLEELNVELRSKGLAGELRLAEDDATFDRGVILRGEKTETNLSAQAVLQRLREENEEEVSRILFGPEERD